MSQRRSLRVLSSLVLLSMVLGLVGPLVPVARAEPLTPPSAASPYIQNPVPRDPVATLPRVVSRRLGWGATLGVKPWQPLRALFARLTPAADEPPDEPVLEPTDVKVRIYLPLVLRGFAIPGYEPIPADGGVLISPDGMHQISFVDQGLPQPLRGAFVDPEVDTRILPLNLQPFGTTFAIEAYWQNDNVPVGALDPDAAPIWEPGMAKPLPAVYDYWAEVRAQVTETQARIVDPDLLTFARLDEETGKWVLLETQYDAASRTARALTERLGTFVLVQNMAYFPSQATQYTLTSPAMVASTAVSDVVEIVVDDQDPGFENQQDPRVPGGPFWFDITQGDIFENHAYYTWNRSDYEDPWLAPGERCNWATWTPALPEAGHYLVSAYIPGSYANTTGATYEIHHADGLDNVNVDQNDASGSFVSLGAFEFTGEGGEHVLLDDVVPETAQLGSQIGFDALMFTYAGEEPPSPEEIAQLFALGMQRWQRYVGDPASASTGNHLQQIVIVSIPGRAGMEMSLVLSYNSLDEEGGVFGAGMSSWLDARLQEYYDGSVMVRIPSGQGLYWTLEGDEYVGWEGVQAELEAEEGGYRVTFPDGTTYFYQSLGLEGRLVRAENRHGNGVDILYGSDGRASAMTDDAGRSLIFTYDGDFISEIEDPLGRTWGFEIEEGYLTTFTNAEGGTFHYTYDDSGLMESLSDPEDITYLVNVSDEEGRVVEQIDGVGSHAYWEYDDDNRETTFTDNLGRPTIYRHDELFRVVEVENALGDVQFHEYDDDYNLTAYVDELGRRWEYAYDERGNLLMEQGPLGWSMTYTYNGDNDLMSATDALERTTTYVWEDGNLVRVAYPGDTSESYTYDGYGQLLSATDANGHTTHFSYDAHGSLIEVRSPEGRMTHYEYDVVGRLVGMTDGNNHTVSLSYDDNDNVVGIVDPKGQETTFEYDGNDMLVKMTDRRGGEWTYEYDANLKLVSETDPEGHETTHTYDKMYQRVSTTDARGNTTLYRYDALYRLQEVVDAMGHVTRFEYDAVGNLTAVVDALEQRTEFEYDDLDRLMLLTDALLGETAFTYDVVGRLVRRENPRHAVTNYAYDERDRLTLTVDALQGETAYEYDAAGNLLAVTDANSHTTSYTYDRDNFLSEVQDPEGHTTTFDHDGVGNVVLMVNGRGYPTEFAYDENDNLNLVTDALGGETAYGYDAEDALVSVTDPNDHTTRFVRDRDGLVVRLIEAGGQITRFEYDATHNLTRLVDARGQITDFVYDALNRQVAMIDPLEHRTEYDYDALNRLVSMTDALSVVTGYEYDALDRLTAVLENLKPGVPADHETNVRTEYGYDPVGNFTSITDANGHTTRFAYDLLNRLIRETDAEEHVWRYEYDPVGNLTRRIDANGDVSDYAYDADDLLTEIAYPNGAEITFAYDENHNQVRMVDELGVTRNTYDALDRLTTSTNHLGQSVGYAYDPAGNRTSVTYPDGRTVRTEYDATNYPVRVVDPDGRTFEAAYDPTHNLTEIQYPNLTRAEMTYDDAGRLTSVLNVQNDGDVISSFDYTLDDVGNRTYVEGYYRWRQPRTLDNSYDYDPLYRLVRSSDSEGRLTEYTYDAVGNRLTMTSNYDPLRTPTDVRKPYTVEYDYSPTNRLLSTDHSVFGLTGYTYDANGNRVRREGPDVWVGNKHDVLRTDYTYNYENRLTSVKNYFDAGNGKWSLRDESAMSYDGYGRLFRRMHDQHQGGGGQKWTEFVYDGLDPIVEYVEPSPQYVNYYRGLGRILEQHGYKSQASPDGTAYFYHYDGLGSVSAITKHRGQAAHTYRYWDYGMALDKNDGTADSSNFTNPHNHYTYTGQNWDDENALYHFYAREYDPVTGVWLQQDPYRGRLVEPRTLHRYGYVKNNPIRYIDVLGYSEEDALIGIKVHQKIQEDYKNSNDGDNIETEKAICGAYDETGGVSPENCRKRPDILNKTTHQAYEIKPYSSYGKRSGPKQLKDYVKILNDLEEANGNTRCWKNGKEWEPSVREFWVYYPGGKAKITVRKSENGVIYYDKDKYPHRKPDWNWDFNWDWRSSVSALLAIMLFILTQGQYQPASAY